MLKFFKYIALLKDIRKEYRVTGTLLNFLASRKVWGLIWIFGGHLARDFFGVELGEDILNQGADLALAVFTYICQGFGIAMEIKSFIDSIRKIIAKIKEDIGEE